MAIARVSASDNTGSGATVTFGSSTTTGNLLIVAAYNASAETTSGGLTVATSAGVNGNAFFITVLYCISTGVNTFTLSNTGVTQWITSEYSGAANPVFLDGTPGTSGNSTSTTTSITTAAITTARAGSLIYEVLGSGTVVLSVTGWTHATTLPSIGNKLAAAQFIPGVTESGYTDTATTNSKTYSTIIAGFGNFITAPSITVSSATALANASATGNGNITSLGDSPVTQSGFVWNTAGTPTLGSNLGSNLTGPTVSGAYSLPMTGLSPNTTYTYRAFATNSTGTTYSAGSGTTFLTTSTSTAGLIDFF